MKKILYAVVGVILLAGAGCSNFVAEKAVEKISGDKVDVSNNGENVNIKTDEGNIQIGETFEVPEGWPTDVPIYPGAVIQLSGSNNSAEPSKNIMLQTKDSSQVVLDFYKRELTAKDWKTEDLYQTQQLSIVNAKKDSSTLMLSVSVNEGSTFITIVIENK